MVNYLSGGRTEDGVGAAGLEISRLTSIRMQGRKLMLEGHTIKYATLVTLAKECQGG